MMDRKINAAHSKQLIFSRYLRIWRCYRMHAFLFALGCLAVGLLGAIANKPSYSASSILEVSDKDIKNEWDILRDETRDVDFEEQILSRGVLEPVVKNLGLFSPKDAINKIEFEQTALQRALKAFKRSLTVERLKNSGIVKITVKSADPSLAARSANAVSESWLDLRRRQVAAHTESLLETLNSHIAKLHSELEQLDILRSEFIVTEVSTQELTKQIVAIEVSLSRAESLYAKSSPLVVRIQREKETLEQIMQEQLYGKREALRNKLLQNKGQEWFVSGHEPELGNLEAALSYTQKRYQELLQQRSQAQLVLDMCRKSSSSFGNLSIIEEAVPPLPKPYWLNIVFIAFLAIAVGSIGIIVLPAVFYLIRLRSRISEPVSSERFLNLVSMRFNPRKIIRKSGNLQLDENKDIAKSFSSSSLTY